MLGGKLMLNNERVILIKGDNSKWYEQAIFIVKKTTEENKMPVNLVFEAEKIINNYMTKGITSNKETAERKVIAKRRNKNLDITLNFLMLMSCIIMAGVMIYNFR